MNQKHVNAAVTAGLVASLMVTSVPAPAIAEALQNDAAPMAVESAVEGQEDVAEVAAPQEAEKDGVPEAADPTIKGVAQPDDLVVSTGSVSLPQTVETQMSDGSTGEAAVAWKVTGELEGTDPAQLPAGSYVLEGTVEGYDQPVELRLEVKESAPAPAEDAADANALPEDTTDAEKGDAPVAPQAEDGVSTQAEATSGTVTDGAGNVYTYDPNFTMIQGFRFLYQGDVTYWPGYDTYGLDIVSESAGSKSISGTFVYDDSVLNTPGTHTISFKLAEYEAETYGVDSLPLTVTVVGVQNVPTQLNYQHLAGDGYNPLDGSVEVLLADGTTQWFSVDWNEAERENFVSNMDNPDTYTIHGTIEGSSYEVTATVWVQEIRSVQPESVYTEPGVAPKLPTYVWVEREDGQQATRSVTWDAIDPSQYAEKNFFEVTGTVEGTDIPALARVYVSAVNSVDATSAITVVGTPAELPSSVGVSFESGYASVDVDWDAPADDDERWATGGTFDVYGTLDNIAGEQAVCHVTVLDSTSYEDEIDVTTTRGVLTLPYSVEIVTEDGQRHFLEVSWDYDSYDWESVEHEGTFDVKGYVLGSDKLPITAHVTVVGVKSIDPIDPVTTTEGVLPDLPDYVDVTYTDGTHGDEWVDWNMPAPEAFTADASPVTVTGTVDGTNQLASIQVNVQWVQPAREVVEVSTLAGWAPELPTDVEMTMSDGTKQRMTVQWETPDPASYATAGESFEVQGYVRGSDYPVTARVGVYDAASGTTIEAVTAPGVAPYLTTYLQVELTNGDELYISERVSWDEIDPKDLVAGGEVDVAGSLLGTPVKLNAHVTVEDIVGLNVSYDLQYAIGTGGTSLPDLVGATLEDGTAISVPVEWGELDEAYLTTPGRYTVKGTAAGREVTCTIDSFRLVSFEITSPLTTIAGVAPDGYGYDYDAIVVHVQDATGDSTREYYYPGEVTWHVTEDDYATAGERDITGTTTIYGSGTTTLQVPVTATLKVYGTVSSYEPVDVWTLPGVAPQLPMYVTVTCDDANVLDLLARAVGLSEDEAETFDAEVEWETVDPALYAADKNNTTFTVDGTIKGTEIPVQATVSVADIANVNVPATVTTAPGVNPQRSLPSWVTVTTTDGKTQSATVSWEDVPGSAYHEAGAEFDVSGSVYLFGNVVREVVTHVVVDAPAEVVGEDEVSGLLDVVTEQGVMPSLPYSVPVRLDSGAVVPMEVSWERQSYSDYTQAGETVEVQGTVEGFAGVPAAKARMLMARVAPTGTVTAKVHVIEAGDEPQVASMLTSYASVIQGEQPETANGLPIGAEVKMSDGTYGYVSVTWDDSTVDYNTPGTYTVHGTTEVGGDAVAFVTVLAPQNEIASVGTFERTFGLPVERDDIAAALPAQVTVTYTNGSTGLAEVSWDLSGLTGEALAKPGDIKITGTVTGTDLTAQATIHLADEGEVYATGVKEPAAVETAETVAPTLPDTVTLEMSDKTTKTTGVTWESVNPADYAFGKGGTSFTVSGITDEGAFTVTQTVNVTKLVRVDGVSISGEGVTDGKATLKKGDKLTLAAQVTPDDAYYQDVTWTSSDPEVATVSEDGVVTAVSGGTATITAASSQPDGPSASVTVTVPRSFSHYELDVEKTEYKIGEKFDPTTVSVSAVYDNGDVEKVDPADLLFDEIDTSKAGTVTVYVNVAADPIQVLDFEIHVSKDGRPETGQGGQQGGSTTDDQGGQSGDKNNQGGDKNDRQPGAGAENEPAPEIPATGDPGTIAGAVSGTGILALLGAWVARRRNRR